MVRVSASARAKNLDSHALPSGGKCDVELRGVSKTVDKPTSALERRRHVISRKPQEESKIFKPLDPNEAPRNPNRGKSLHTDPFAADREEYKPKRCSKVVEVPKTEPKPERRHAKPAPGPSSPKKPGFISANGLTHTSPKRVPKEKFAMTLHKEQPAKTYNTSRRFAASPDKASCGEFSPSATSNGTSAAFGGDEVSPSRVRSQVFPGGVMPPAALTSPTRQQSLRIKADQRNQPTLSGVWGPMPGGKAPKPSSQAPWLQEQAAGRAHCKGHQHRPVTSSQAPFAIGM